jgi:hypothetical protein
MLRNVIIWGNVAGNGHSIYHVNSTPTIASSDIQGCGSSGSTTWSESCGTDNGGNIQADPRFVDADGPDTIPGTLDDNLRLQPGSPAIDAGTTAFLPADLTTDLDGQPRVDGRRVDMGAYDLGFQRRSLPLVIRSRGRPAAPGAIRAHTGQRGQR